MNGGTRQSPRQSPTWPAKATCRCSTAPALCAGCCRLVTRPTGPQHAQAPWPEGPMLSDATAISSAALVPFARARRAHRQLGEVAAEVVVAGHRRQRRDRRAQVSQHIQPGRTQPSQAQDNALPGPTSRPASAWLPCTAKVGARAKADDKQPMWLGGFEILSACGGSAITHSAQPKHADQPALAVRTYASHEGVQDHTRAACGRTWCQTRRRTRGCRTARSSPWRCGWAPGSTPCPAGASRIGYEVNANSSSAVNATSS